MKTIDKNSNYRCEFKDGNGRSLFIHIHCLLATYDTKESRPDLTEDEYIDYLRNRMWEVYQLMNFYLWVLLYGNLSGDSLAFFKELDEESLRYITWTPVK